MSCQRHVFEAAFEAFLQGSDPLSKQQWEDLAPAKAKILVVQESENWVPRKPSKPPWFIMGIFLVCHLRIFKGVSMSIPFLRQTMTNPWGIHPASRGVAAHTAGLFRSVRGAKGGFPPWGLFK